MAQRLATEYKQILLQLTSQQLHEFMHLFKGKNYLTEVRVYENGDTEFILFDDGHELPLAFRSIGLMFQFEGSYIIRDLELSQMMRRVIHDFKGNAVVHRIYNQYVMEYDYKHGNVVRIIERKADDTATLVYEFKDTIGSLTTLFTERGAEDQISWVKLQIDMLLIQRSKEKSVEAIQSIDHQLKELSQELFILEA